MFCVLVGAGREIQAILSVYLSTLLAGYGTGFSAVALPGIKQEMRLIPDSGIITLLIVIVYN